MKLHYAVLAATLSIAACEKKPDAAPAPGASATEAAVGAGAAAAAPTGASAVAAPGKGATGAAAGGAAATPAAGGTVVAANNNGKVLVNDAGTVTARRADGDSVTKDKNGVTNANGVVVDPKKGTVSVPGMGTFATPPGAQ